MGKKIISFEDIAIEQVNVIIKKDKQIKELETKLHEIAEEYIGMDGLEPETAPEDYLQNLLKRMYEIAKR